MSMIDIIVYEILSMSFLKACLTLGLGLVIFLGFPIFIYRFLKSTLKRLPVIIILTIISSIPTVIYLYIVSKIIFI